MTDDTGPTAGATRPTTERELEVRMKQQLAARHAKVTRAAEQATATEIDRYKARLAEAGDQSIREIRAKTAESLEAIEGVLVALTAVTSGATAAHTRQLARWGMPVAALGALVIILAVAIAVETYRLTQMRAGMAELRQTQHHLRELDGLTVLRDADGRRWIVSGRPFGSPTPLADGRYGVLVAD